MRTLQSGVTITDTQIMNEDFYTFNGKLNSLNFPPKASNWQCQVIGGPMGIVLTPSEGHEPNWFHRKMQELCFGFKWRKIK